MSIEIITEKIGTKLFRLSIYHSGKYIGEYERSQENDIKRKTKEIESSENILLEIFKKHGSFVVRWNKNENEKTVRVDKIKVGVIPKKYWEQPSWS